MERNQKRLFESGRVAGSRVPNFAFLALEPFFHLASLLDPFDHILGEMECQYTLGRTGYHFPAPRLENTIRSSVAAIPLSRQ